jgi:hypothetical protein
VFPDDGGKRLKLDPDSLPLGAPWTRVPVDPLRQQTWRWLLFADQLTLRPGKHEAALRRLRWMTLGWKSALLLTFAGLPIGRMVFDRMVTERFKQAPATDIENLLARERPDVVLHPTVLDGVFINDIIAVCRARDIPIVLAMNSWDNPSTKRAAVGKPNKLLVWGPQTRDHAVRFIGLDPHDVIPFGAAQFDVFRDPPTLNRDEFCTRQRIDPRFPLIVVAGSNAQIDEFRLLERLDHAVESGQLPRINFIYRPHPWGNGGIGGKRLATGAWQHITVDANMRDYLTRLAAGDTSISLPDYRDTHDLLSIVDGLISPVSTILAEAALHAKPVISYQPLEESKMLQMMVPLLHLEEFLSQPEVLTAQSFETLVQHIGTILDPNDGPQRGSRLARNSSRFVTPFSRPWKDRIVDLLADVVSERRQQRAAAAMEASGAL